MRTQSLVFDAKTFLGTFNLGYLHTVELGP